MCDIVGPWEWFEDLDLPDILQGQGGNTFKTDFSLRQLPAPMATPGNSAVHRAYVFTVTLI